MISLPISALTFDAAGTLIHLSEPVGYSYSRVAAQFEIYANPDKMESAFRAVWKVTPPAFSEPPSKRHPNEKAWWHDLVESVFREAGADLPDDETFDLCFEALYDHFESPGTWIAEPDTAETLERICSRYPSVILSNFDSRLRRILKDLDLDQYFEDLFLSCEIGASKPDPKMFDTALDHFQCPREEIIHIGDDALCDTEGASRAGFQHYRIQKGSGSLSELLRELSLA